MHLGTRSHCFCQSRFYCSALIMVLSLLSLPLKSWAANSANDSDTAIVSKRETLQLIVAGGSPKIDSLVRAKLIPELSTRFDVVQDTAEYLLEFGGEMEMSDDTLMTTKFLTLQAEAQNIHYRVFFTPPGGERALLFQEMVITNDWLFGTFGTESVADKIMWKIEAEFPPPVAVASVEGSMVMLTVGSQAGLRLGDRFQLSDGDGGEAALVEVTQLDSEHAYAKTLRGGGIEPGYTAVRIPRLSGVGVGLEYTQFRIEDSGLTKTGRQLMLNVPYRPRQMRPLILQFSSGYLDVAVERGWHMLNVDLILPVSLIRDRWHLEAVGGGGLSLMRLTSKVDPVTQEKTKALVMLNYNVAVNSAFYFSRQLAVTVACGYLSYSRFPTPKGVSLQAGIRFWGK